MKEDLDEFKNQQLRTLIERDNDIIASKERQIRLADVRLDMIKEEEMKLTIQVKECKHGISKLMNEIAEVKIEIAKAKDELYGQRTR